MSLRQFTDRDGAQWSVWMVQPSAASNQVLQERYRSGWLCFERTGFTERLRLPIGDAPSPWESLPDERLELLCRMAQMAAVTPLSKRMETPSPHTTRTAIENEAKRRVSGPSDSSANDLSSDKQKRRTE